MARAAKKQPSPRRTLTKEELIRVGVPESNLFQNENGRWLLRREWRGQIRFRKPSSGKTKGPRRSERDRTRSEAAALVRNAKAGDLDSAVLVLIRFCEAVECGDRVPLEILVWFRRTFRRWLARRSLSLNDLLQLPSGQEGAPQDPSLPARNRRIARRVNALLGRGIKMKVAVLQAAGEFNLSQRTVENVMADFAKALRDARDDQDAKKRAIDNLFPEERKALRR